MNVKNEFYNKIEIFFQLSFFAFLAVAFAAPAPEPSAILASYAPAIGPVAYKAPLAYAPQLGYAPLPAAPLTYGAPFAYSAYPAPIAYSKFY